MRMTQTWLSVPTVASQLKVTDRTVHNWIDSGKLEAREEYHGRQRRRYIEATALAQFVATTLPPQPTAVES